MPTNFGVRLLRDQTEYSERLQISAKRRRGAGGELYFMHAAASRSGRALASTSAARSNISKYARRKGPKVSRRRMVRSVQDPPSAPNSMSASESVTDGTVRPVANSHSGSDSPSRI